MRSQVRNPEDASQEIAEGVIREHIVVPHAGFPHYLIDANAKPL
jgi:hypothetical protein